MKDIYYWKEFMIYFIYVFLYITLFILFILFNLTFFLVYFFFINLTFIYLLWISYSNISWILKYGPSSNFFEKYSFIF